MSPRRRLPSRRPLLLLVGLALVAVGACSRAPREITDAERAEPGRVFLLGFDGLDPELVAAWEKDGLLPNFARLRAEGAVGNVRSTVPMISPPAWTTVATGTDPGDHGIWSFWLPAGDDPRGRYVDATQRLAPAIWETLTERGRTVGIVNVPISSPPDSVNGFLVAGFPYRTGAPLTWPPSLEADIVARGWERDAFLGPPSPGTESAWLEQKLRTAAARREIALSLLFDRKPDLSFVVFTTPDRIQHHLWRFHDPEHPLYRADAPEPLRRAVRDIYVWCDDVLGEVMDRLDDDTTLIVLADHGFTAAALGVSKGRLVASLPADVRGSVVSSRNLFGGDFYLAEGTDDATRERVVRAMGAATLPDGRRVASAVHEPSRLPARGFAADLGPDVYLEETEGLLLVPGEANGPLAGTLGPTSFSGWHRRLGYFGIRGRPVLAGPVRDLDLHDVPALALHLLGETIPRRYVHNIPRKLFPVGYFVERPMALDGETTDGLRRPGEAPAVDPAEADAIAEQLKSVGYLN